VTERINDFCCTGWWPEPKKVEPDAEIIIQAAADFVAFRDELIWSEAEELDRQFEISFARYGS
jgi:hypothetical protein